MDPASILITRNTYKNSLNYIDLPVLKYTINFPQFYCDGYENQITHINLHLSNKAVEYRSYAQNILYPEAVKSRNCPVQGGHGEVFELYVEYTVTFNQNGLISLYFDDYRYRGGAHGETLRTAETWKVPAGEQLMLEDFFPKNNNFEMELQREITDQIQENRRNGAGIYYSNAGDLVNKNFDRDNYYVLASPSRLCIFFQEYIIAPYVMGIPTFEIPVE